MTREPLLLTAEQVPVGALVNIVAPGTDTPVIQDGNPLPVVKLIGGIPNREKLYVAVIEGQNINIGQSSDVGSVADGVRFTPAVTYVADSAPVDGKYAVFSSGRRAKVDESPVALEVVKANDGNLYVARFPIEPHSMMRNERYAEDIRYSDYREMTDRGLASLIGWQVSHLEGLRKGEKWLSFISHRPKENGVQLSQVSDNDLRQMVEWDFNHPPMLSSTDYNPAISRAEFDLEKMAEVYAGRFRESPSSVVEALKQLDPGYQFLTVAKIPSNSLLVRTDSAGRNLDAIAA